MLKFTIHHLGDVAVFHCTGRLTADIETGLHSAVATQSAARTLVLDLANVSAVDAAGLGALVELRAAASVAGKHLKLTNLTPRVEALLQLTKLSTLFEICSLAELRNSVCQTGDRPRAIAVVMTDSAQCPCSPESAERSGREMQFHC